MKHSLFFVFGLLFAVSIAHATESFDSIYKKNINARGGSEIVKSAKTFIITGELTREDSVHFYFRAAYKLPNKLIVEYYQKADTIAVGYDGTNAWTIMPRLSNDIIELPQSAAIEATTMTVFPVIEFFNRLDNYKDVKSKIKITDTEVLDSIPQFKLICPNKSGTTDIIMVNQTDYLISQLTTEFQYSGKTVTATIKLKDYLAASTLNMPNYVKVTNGVNNIVELKLSSIELNPDLNDVIFEIPKLIK